MIKVDNNIIILLITIIFFSGIYAMSNEKEKYSGYIYSVVILSIFIFVVYMWAMYLQEEYRLQSDPKLKELKTKIAPLFAKDKKYTGVLSRINNRDILNEITLYKGDKSYTINKHKIYLCLTDDKDEYYNDMMLMYVFLHEISHTLCNSIGHTDEFNQIFDALLEEASNMGIYDSTYMPIQNYCQY